MSSWLLLLLSCGPRAHLLPSLAPQAPGGKVERLDLSVVGPGGAPPIDPSGSVVLLGDQVPRASTRHWMQAAARWQPLAEDTALLVGAGRGESRGDRTLQGWQQVFGVGPGWTSWDVQVGAEAWRLLMLRSDRQAMGSAWAEQLYWLPATVSAGHDHLVVFLPAGEGGSMLLEAVLDHAPHDTLVAVFQGSDASAAELPGGPWGEARISVPGHTLWRLSVGSDGIRISAEGAGETTLTRSPQAGWRTE
jgi:hypothetical protein